MPLIPSFHAYAPAPDLSQAFLGGQQIQVARERIAQEAMADAARIQLGREQLAQHAIQNEMELAAKKEALSRESMRREQEQEIEKAYRETQLGLATRELEQHKLINEMKLKQAAQSFDAIQRWRQRVDAGETPEEAWQKEGAGQPGFAASLNSQDPYTALNFQSRQLDAEEREIMRKYPGMTVRAMKPEDQTALADISRRRRSLAPPSNVVGTNQFKTAEDVRAAFKSNQISREAARKILAEQFGMR